VNAPHAALEPHIERLVAAGEIGGRTVRITAGGSVDCHEYPVLPLAPGQVRVRTTGSAISPGTELTYLGPSAPNVYLHRTWDPALRVFLAGRAHVAHPIVFGYRATGTVVESNAGMTPGTRVYGRWRHTEYVALNVADALAQRVPDGLSDDDALDLGQMAPIGVNAVAEAGAEHAGAPAVVYGAGPIGLMVAQVARASGARDVTVVDRLAERCAIAARLGLATVHAPPGEDAAATLKRRFGANGVPVAFECSGSAAALHQAIRTVRRRGTVIAVGFYQGEPSALRLGDEFHHNAVRLIPAQIGNIHPAWSLLRLRERAIDLVGAGQLVLGGLPRVELPVERAADGFAALRRPAETFQVVFRY